MSKQDITELSEDEFDRLVDDHIEHPVEELPTELFVDLLLERIAAKRDSTLTLNIVINGDELVIMPDHDDSEVLVQGNQVLVGGHRLVLQLIQPSTKDDIQIVISGNS